MLLNFDYDYRQYRHFSSDMHCKMCNNSKAFVKKQTCNLSTKSNCDSDPCEVDPCSFTEFRKYLLDGYCVLVLETACSFSSNRQDFCG